MVGVVLLVVVYVTILYHFFVTPLSFRWRAIFGEPNYPEGYEVYGIDISHYQATIDWLQLRNAKVGGRPLTFVVVKATEGTDLVDQNFNDNFYQARHHDLVRGAYHFYRPSSDPARQARFFLRQAHLEPGDLPPVLDVEVRGNAPLERFQKDVLEWLRIVEDAYGVKPIIYANLDFKAKYLSTPSFDAYPLWVANYYKPELCYDGSWVMWQFTDMGQVDGIRHRVDLNLLNGSMADLRSLLIPEEAGTTL